MAALKLLKELLQGSPGALRKLEKLMDEAPRTIELYQNRPLASALKVAADEREPGDLAIIDPDQFQHLARPIEGLHGETRQYLEEVTPEKVKGLKAVLSGDVSGIDTEYGPARHYFDESRMKAISEPGFEDVGFLSLEESYPGIAQVMGHESRHRNRAVAELGHRNNLIRLKPHYSYTYDNNGMWVPTSRARGQKPEVIEALKDPDTAVHQEGTGYYRGTAGDLFKILGIGGLSALPMLEE